MVQIEREVGYIYLYHGQSKNVFVRIVMRTLPQDNDPTIELVGQAEELRKKKKNRRRHQ